MGFRVFCLSLNIVSFALLANASSAQVIDGPPGNHVEKSGTIFNIFVPVHALVPESVYGGTDGRKRQRLDEAVTARAKAGARLFRKTVQNQLDQEPPYRGCYRFYIRGRWKALFAADGGYDFRRTPYHTLKIDAKIQGVRMQPRDPYRRSLRGLWGTKLTAPMNQVDSAIVSGSLMQLVGLINPPYSQSLGDKINAIYQQKTGTELPGCYALNRHWTERGIADAGKNHRGHGRLNLAVAPSGVRDGKLKGWGRWQAEASNDSGWREKQHGSFKVTGMLEANYLRLTFEDWQGVHSSRTPAGVPSIRPIRSKRLPTITVGPLVNGAYEGQEPVNGIARGDKTFVVPAPVLTTIKTKVHESK